MKLLAKQSSSWKLSFQKATDNSDAMGYSPDVCGNILAGISSLDAAWIRSSCCTGESAARWMGVSVDPTTSGANSLMQINRRLCFPLTELGGRSRCKTPSARFQARGRSA